MTMKLTDYLGDKPFWKVTVRLAVPVALQNVLTSSFQLVDTLMVSRLGDVTLSAVGMAVLNMGGGATVPLFGSLFSGMARAVPEGTTELTKEQLAEAFKSGEARLLKFSKAPLGGKTMVDALTPAVAAFADYGGADIAAALEAARLAAHEGCMKTKDYVAHFGRAKNLGERALGIPDPGSVSVSIIFKAFAKSVAEE